MPDAARWRAALLLGHDKHSLPVHLVEADLFDGGRGDERPGQLDKPVPSLDEVAILHAAHSSLVTLDAEREVAAVPVGERCDGLKDLALGLAGVRRGADA